VYVVWIRILPTDDADAAARSDAELLPDDPRVTSYWDGERALGIDLGRRLAIPARSRPSAVAWDVYLLYPAGAAWESPPQLWMHQLEAVDERQAPLLDADVLRERVQGLLR
jgi:hypothetical protein